MLKCPATTYRPESLADQWPTLCCHFSPLLLNHRPEAGHNNQQASDLPATFFSWIIQSSSCSSHNGHKPSTQMGHPNVGHITMCEQSHGRRLTAHSPRLPEVSVIYCSQKVCYSSQASKECLKCKSAAENASFHHSFDSKFKFCGAQLIKPYLWGSFKTNFINIHTHTSFIVLVKNVQINSGMSTPFRSEINVSHYHASRSSPS